MNVVLSHSMDVYMHKAMAPGGDPFSPYSLFGRLTVPQPELLSLSAVVGRNKCGP